MRPSGKAELNVSPIDAQLAAPTASYGDHSARASARPGEATPGVFADMIQHRGAVLGILFLVTGAIGLPLLWMNKKFSTAERIVWSIIVTLYTIILIGIVCWIVLWSFRQIRGY